MDLYKVVYWARGAVKPTAEQTIAASSLTQAKRQASYWKHVEGRWYQCESYTPPNNGKINEYVKVGSNDMQAPRLFVIPLPPEEIDPNEF